MVLGLLLQPGGLSENLALAFFFFLRSQPPYQVEKTSARGWCVRRGNLLQDHLPVKFQYVKFKDPKYLSMKFL